LVDVAVIGGGFGGLAAALRLASAGLRVTLFEASSSVGGKAGEVVVDGVAFDTGPSVLTLPSILQALFEDAGATFEDEVTLVRPDPSFCYRWPDGTQVQIFQDPTESERAIGLALGGTAAREFSSFMRYSRGIWEAAAPHFVLAQAPSISSVAALGLVGIRAAAQIDPFRTMRRAIETQVTDPYLRDILLRFATYNGSDPSLAPATLNCIAHVEMGIGAFGVKGGMHMLVRALERVCLRKGVQIRTGEPISRIVRGREGVTALVLASGETIGVDRVVVNADVAHLIEDLLPNAQGAGLTVPTQRSTSGWTAVVRARRRARPAHLALFPKVYASEFRDLFELDRPPLDPTVYVCAQEVAHGRSGWESHEPLFVMANAPAEPSGSDRRTEVWEALRATVIERLIDGSVIDRDDEIVWERSPSDLARAFPGSRGALYGAASNGMMSAFQRPPNRVPRVRGLYLASGSAHPGGDVPLCIQSGRLAAQACLDDLGSAR
jgi:1-hydroxycarotenoid 3,4-desaturase